MKNRKPIFAAALLLTFTLTACGTSPTETTPQQAETSQQTQPSVEVQTPEPENLTPAPDGVVGSSGSGYGDDVVTDIQIPDETYVYRVHFTNTGERNFIVYSFDADGEEELLVNEIGAFDSYVPLIGEAPYTFEVQSDGSWTYSVEAITATDETSFAGTGDTVTQIFPVTPGAWEFTHTGEHNFIIHLYTLGEKENLVNEIGVYQGKSIVRVPDGTIGYLEVQADGSWTASPVQ